MIFSEKIESKSMIIMRLFNRNLKRALLLLDLTPVAKDSLARMLTIKICKTYCKNANFYK